MTKNMDTNPYGGWDEELKKYLGDCGDHHVYLGKYLVIPDPSRIYLSHHVRIDPFTLITCGLIVDHHSHIGSHVVIGGGSKYQVTMGKWTTLVYGSKLLCGSENATGNFGPINVPWGKNLVKGGNITIEDFGVVFSNCIVMPSVTIPEGCVIGMGSIVNPRDMRIIEPWCVYQGSPIRFLYKRNKQRILELADDPSFLLDED